jgi:hypothetical protein
MARPRPTRIDLIVEVITALFFAALGMAALIGG